METADERRRPGFWQGSNRNPPGRTHKPTICSESLNEGSRSCIPDPPSGRSGYGSGYRPVAPQQSDGDAVAVASGQEFARTVERIEQNEEWRGRLLANTLLADHRNARQKPR